MSELRLYSFCNYYLSSIQQGIQTAHLVHELFINYNQQHTGKILYDWAENHKTIIVLNGGDNQSIDDIAQKLYSSCDDLRLPHGTFNEDERSLNELMTCCGAVIPEEYFNALDFKRMINSLNPKDARTFMETYSNAREGGWYFYYPEMKELSLRFDERKLVVYQPQTSETQLIDVIKSCGLAR